MKKKKSSFLDKLYTGIFILIFFSLSKGCISDYIKGGDNKAISNYEKMLFDSTVATAMYEPEYKEVTVKIAHIPIKTYEFRYKFFVGIQSYEGGVTLNQLPTKATLPVFYLKEDPYFNSTDPASALAKEKEKNSSKAPLYWGIAWGLIALFALMGFVSELRKPKVPDEELAAG
jgi:hypothetical protein